MNTEQKDTEAGKEEEKGNVQERRYCLDHPRKMRPLDAFGKECADSPSLLLAFLWRLGESAVSPRPLLHRCCN